MSNTKLPELLRRVAHELRTYNPAADEYKGQHIHGVWAREIDAAIALHDADRERQAGEAVTVESIRAAGGIVHGDGNIFFTNIAQLRASLPAPQAVQAGLGPLSERTVLDAIRSAYDLGYNDARNARALPGDGAPGYKGRDVEADHGGALISRLRMLAAAAPSPDGKAEQAEAPSEPMRAHIEQFATRAGWKMEEGEGAFEFVQRKCYQQGWIDHGTKSRDREDDTSASQDQGPDTGRVSGESGPAAEQHNEHRTGQSGADREHDQRDCRGAGLHGASNLPPQVAQKPDFIYNGERGRDAEDLLDGYNHGTAFYASPVLLRIDRAIEPLTSGEIRALMAKHGIAFANINTVEALVRDVELEHGRGVANPKARAAHSPASGVVERDENGNLPCPFCGGECDPAGWLGGDGKRGPECEECGATAESTEVWNTRAALATKPTASSEQAEAPSDDCPSCSGTGSGGFGIGCTDCLGTGRDSRAQGCPTCKRTDGNMCDWCPSMPTASNAGERETFMYPAGAPDAWKEGAEPSHPQFVKGFAAGHARGRQRGIAALAIKPPAGEQKPVARLFRDGSSTGIGPVYGTVEDMKVLDAVPDGAALYLGPQPEQVAQDGEDAERWRAFISLEYKVRAEWASNLSLAPVLTAWVDQLAARARGEGGDKG